MEYYDTHRLVKSEDLNHHGTLFAGRMTEWFVESCFITVANEYKHPENLVCLKVHEVKFSKPIRKGDIINIKSKIVYAGKTSLTVYGKVLRDSNTIVEGFLTFVCVDNDGVKMPHNLVLQEPRTEEDIKLLERVNNLRK
ncbi:acyl-CoA thioesterase [Paeniclostridium sordellii]|uniref:acyl-CoA thioesterase n=1 Tax=Paraclostridium sordellii TaxID=1505 RepID=UPI0005DED08E|nr:hotdog domain-containing protein [Paeniclostridium sordellii]MBX9182131.1 acyl-CoA thioesterase [Paeniclostridium sordellii]MDU2688040.1 hotdog domain-containing protein [Paeniclostridium sordellii]MDU6247738.1 hotdog domain-containing protein [Paeniclostridium sordellii]MVO72421.1 acyl-CoA thioesterase [Paeniclostridium sordellii]CEO15510.1 thioesterase superfamily protein YciA [[Clostridium] sordellii] [Paeniclostridium sordellii]